MRLLANFQKFILLLASSAPMTFEAQEICLHWFGEEWKFKIKKKKSTDFTFKLHSSDQQLHKYTSELSAKTSRQHITACKSISPASWALFLVFYIYSLHLIAISKEYKWKKTEPQLA